MKTYVLKYTCIDDASQKEQSFEVCTDNVDKAIDSLVSSFSKDFNPANIDIKSIVENGEDLGIDGIYNAELSLAKYYN